MKIGIFQDLHANLPALKKAIEVFQKEQCDTIIHVGDFIGVGPYPQECMELGLNIKEIQFVMGNHDYWYAFGLPTPLPKSMNQEEADHQNWVRQQIGEQYLAIVQQWPFFIDIELEAKYKLRFQHYNLTEDKRWFKGFLHKPTTETLDVLFEGVEADFIFYGHQHIAHDAMGRCRYVNLGSAGCWDKPVVRLAILELVDGEINLDKRAIPYEDNGLIEAYEERQVPAREFLTQFLIVRNKNS